MNKRRIGLTAILIILVVLVGLFWTLIGFITDYFWFRELGYTSVFFKQLFTQLKLGIPTFIILTILFYLYLMGLKRGYYKRVEIAPNPGVKEKTLNSIALGISAIFGILITLTTVTKLWFEILKFANSTEFGIADPIFDMDISFYIFRLELITHASQILIGVIIAFVILTLIFYSLLLSLRRPRIFERQEGGEFEYGPNGEQRYTGNFSQGFGAFGQNINDMFGGMFKGFNPPGRGSTQLDKDNLKQLLAIASKQIKVLSVIFFLMVGVNFWLKQYQLLYSSTGVVYGAGFTDINVTLWVYRALIALSVVAAVTFVVGFQKRKPKMMLAVPLIMIILSIAGSGAAMTVQNFIVSPDEINKEYPYLQNNITYTQYAYDLQDIVTKEFAASNTLTKEDIINNMGTISNIRINDFEPAEKFYNQAQNLRTYYRFNDVDVDRYMINGEYTQTFLSAREIDETNPLIMDQPWLSKHLKYTHGYGIVLSRVDKVTESGQPDMLIKNIPPESAVEEITIERPEIYFGELTYKYVITNTDEQEFDYPSGDTNVYTTYEGEAGIPLNMFNRILFSIRERSLKILVSSNIDSNSKIHIYRNIRERAEKIAPFLSYDADPYIVVADGKLYWMIDAYTYSSYYPYSEPFSPDTRVNYIRNSIKVVIDAYNGHTNFYLVDDEDPIANTLKKIYPKLFKDFDEMPESLQKHIRYPNMLFSIQASIYTKYHMNDVKVFYLDEDRWEISQEIYGTEPQQMHPNYYIMKLPGEEKEEFINSIPYTPYGKKNMMALLVARNDGDHYGELMLYRLPKSKIVYGPMQIESFIDQQTEISKEFSLWNSAGSSYNRGNMFVIPIEDSLVYVEPIYLEATNSSLPEVKRVIIYYNDRIAYEPSLGQALDAMFGAGSGSPLNGEAPQPGEDPSDTPGGEILDTDALIRRAVEAYNNAISAQQRGDWASYGRYLRELEDYLNRLNPESAAGAVMEDEEEETGVVPVL
ncbi:MAG: UPF0182 family protein [Bacillota bacterium]|nr:UPF0182 family protein [Bacillota bacterium]